MITTDDYKDIYIWELGKGQGQVRVEEVLFLKGESMRLLAGWWKEGDLCENTDWPHWASA